MWEQAGVDIDMAMGTYASRDVDGQLPFAVRKGQGHLLLQRTEGAMKDSQAGAAMRTRHVTGLRMQALSQDEVLDLEPALDAASCKPRRPPTPDEQTQGPRQACYSHVRASPWAGAGGAWFFPDGWFLSEPRALLQALAAGLERGGGELRTEANPTLTLP